MKQVKITPQEAISILLNEAVIRGVFDNTQENTEEYYKRDLALRMAIKSIETVATIYKHVDGTWPRASIYYLHDTIQKNMEGMDFESDN